ncbi:MAG: peptide ABC transporter permease [Candidatus Lambdaproteobacteria bacterium RIFOXYD1_FULL_56_27]|uniref:Peptide ABC transporter permease n=1 Tax=Candidatus Lambdaproteobacteria bacterium RIFOXYD2_FULL_56_26 TaxID=1817773 RepID=A0A1F6GRR6_9PROT|nr:MAG: peptide ABC transporter permease [Candidatus Lambdaproteobacteria bacterium RIFOXYC1_FULL_56_13]OGH00876.1 MAG: peptide ABC transporter permease [Candidatus Lambdaproteobacteria bacterium RIFOXYD2_FULL_56_26]OGH08703.1 MAG: peptide ABC transporter permease [Candidatus Lambdaproteobacteria bacterium RIFOXYD1_FULL_56_27]
MFLFHLHPSTKARLYRFSRIKRGLWSFWILVALMVASLGLELWVSHRALLVRYEGKLYFPSYGSILPGTTFGLDYGYETNYRNLKATWAENGEGFVLLPLVPYGPYENDLGLENNPPNPPNFEMGHYLGTDNSGRDILARLLYGFRVAILFSFALYLTTSGLGILVGSLMGYFGGLFDLLMQRLVEVWTSIPTLYLILIMAALMTPNFWLLLGILVFVGWTDMTWLMRAEIYREKSRQYAEAARSMGASHLRIVVLHLLPNATVPIIARLPFQMVAGIGALTSLDYLGYGLPIPTPSWGELLRQGQEAFDYAPWILLSPSVATVLVLLLFTFIGEAVRESFDPKRVTLYE